MIIPSIARLTLAARAKRQVACEIVARLFSFWQEGAEREGVPPISWGPTDNPDLARRYLDRVRRHVEESESDDDPNRLARLSEAFIECLREANSQLSNLAEDLSRALSGVASNWDRISNPFLICRVLRQGVSDLARERADAQHRYDGGNATTEATRLRYEAQRNRAQAIESNRNAVQSNVPNQSSAVSFVAPIVISLLIGVIAAFLLNRFFGGTWTGWLAGFVVAFSVFVLFLRRRGSDIADAGGLEQTNIFPEAFKVALYDYASAQIAQYVAERKLRLWEERGQALSSLIAQRELTDLGVKLDEITLRLKRQQADEPLGFFDEAMPGEILLRGRALTRLIVDDLENRSDRERLMNAAVSSLTAQSINPQHLARGVVADTVEELVSAAESVIGDLKFSSVMSLVLENPQGAVAAESWLRRFRDEVLAPARLHEGVSRDSRVRETLRCGLPGGLADPLAREIARRLDCDIQDSTVPNGLELVCISRNIYLDDLRSTQDLRKAYEVLPQEVREILFDFPSRAEVDSQAFSSSVEDDTLASVPVSRDRAHENGKVSRPSFRRRLGHPFRKRAS